jgi:hypothetical protein
MCCKAGSAAPGIIEHPAKHLEPSRAFAGELLNDGNWKAGGISRIGDRWAPRRRMSLSRAVAIATVDAGGALKGGGR